MSIVKAEHHDILSGDKRTLAHCRVKSLCNCIVNAEYSLYARIIIKQAFRLSDSQLVHIGLFIVPA